MAQFLKNYFSERAQKKERHQLWKQQVQDMAGAIKARNPARISSLWEYADSNMKESLYLALVKDAVATDDIEVFKAFFKGNPDPNLLINGFSAFGFVAQDEWRPLLALAIESRALEIALFLANHPDLDPDIKGTCQIFPRIPFTEEHVPSLIERASNVPGMEEVAVVLAKRKWQAQQASQSPSCNPA